MTYQELLDALQDCTPAQLTEEVFVVVPGGEMGLLAKELDGGDLLLMIEEDI